MLLEGQKGQKMTRAEQLLLEIRDRGSMRVSEMRDFLGYSPGSILYGNFRVVGIAERFLKRNKDGSYSLRRKNTRIDPTQAFNPTRFNSRGTHPYLGGAII